MCNTKMTSPTEWKALSKQIKEILTEMLSIDDIKILIPVLREKIGPVIDNFRPQISILLRNTRMGRGIKKAGFLLEEN